MSDPESDDYRARWWLALLGKPWFRILLLVGSGAMFVSLFVSPSHKDGTPLGPGEFVVKLAMLTIAAGYVLSMELRRRREQRMRKFKQVDDTDREHP